MSQPPAVSTEMISVLNNATPALEPPYEQRQQEQGHCHDWMRNDRSILLIVTTLVTTLTYQVGTNLPGGFYQDDNNGHHAGDSILHDKHPYRYWAFMVASRLGFVSSMFTTLALLNGACPESRLVRWTFRVAYPCLALTFFSSQLDYKFWIDLLFLVDRRRH